MWHMDEPVADPAALATYLICSAASKRLTVILSGMGGDEVFAGYPRHLAARIARLADVLPQAARKGLRQLVETHVGIGAPGRLRAPRRNALKLLRGIDLPPQERYLTYCSYYRPNELPGILSADVRSELTRHDPFRRHRDYLAKVSGEHWLNQFLYLDMKTFLPCLNLTYTDKMSMAASTEVRVPLLDDELVALSGRIPPALKLRRMTRKYILKRAMESRLPQRGDLAPEGRIRRANSLVARWGPPPHGRRPPFRRARSRAWSVRARCSEAFGRRLHPLARGQRLADLGAANARALATTVHRQTAHVGSAERA